MDNEKEFNIVIADGITDKDLKTNVPIVALVLNDWDDFGHKVSFNVYTNGFLEDQKNLKTTKKCWKTRLLAVKNSKLLEGAEIVQEYNDLFGKGKPVPISKFSADFNCLRYSAMSNENSIIFYLSGANLAFNDVNILKKYLKAVKDDPFNPTDYPNCNWFFENVLYRSDMTRKVKNLSQSLKQMDGHLNVADVGAEKFNNGEAEKYFITDHSLEKIGEEIKHKEQFGIFFTHKLLQVSNDHIGQQKKKIIEVLELADKTYPDKDELRDEIHSKLTSLRSDFNEDKSKKIYEIINKIKSFLKVDPQENEIGHYTSIETLQFLLGNDASLRLTNGRQLNDIAEGKKLLEIIDNKIAKNSKIAKKVQLLTLFRGKKTNYYISSATSAKDSLLMWNMYGNDGKGVFLQYSREFIEANRNYIYKVGYLDDSAGILRAYVNGVENRDLATEINNLIKAIKNLTDDELKSLNESLYNDIDKLSFLFKDVAYKEEKEYRILQTINVKEDLKKLVTPSFKCEEGKARYYLYVKFHNETTITSEEATIIKPEYSLIVIGPKSNSEKDYIEPYINLMGLDSKTEITVEHSKIEYR